MRVLLGTQPAAHNDNGPKTECHESGGDQAIHTFATSETRIKQTGIRQLCRQYNTPTTT